MAGDGQAGGWHGQPFNESATVSGPPTIDSDRVTRPLSNPSRDPSRDHVMSVASDEARQVISHEAGEHENVHVFMSRVPSTPQNESTDEPQVDSTRRGTTLTRGPEGPCATIGMRT